jgi:hypothetical protein
MSTKTIHVATPFTLNLGGESGPLKIGVGIQTVPDEVADHWFTKAHLSDGGLGAQAYAEAQRAQADQAFVKIKEQTAIWFAFERATVDAEVAANLDLSTPAFERLGPETDEDKAAMSPSALDEYREAAQKELDARRAAEAAPEGEGQKDEFDAMSDDELRAFITKRDDKAPRANTGRVKLLLAARGDQGAAADIENGTQGS